MFVSAPRPRAAGVPAAVMPGLLVAALVVLIGGCESLSTERATPPPPAPPVAAPPAPAVPVLSPAEARAQAARLADDALLLLQNGDEPAARAALDQALALDSGNEIARKLADQIRADARQELGATSYPYTVQPGDTLAKIAAAHLGDRYRFYILAKYNGITNPSRLLVGQTIRIPGTAPAAVRAPSPGAAAEPAAAAHATPPAAAPAVAPVAPPAAAPVPTARRREAERLLADGIAQHKGGRLEAAYESFTAALARDPGFEPAMQQRDAVRQELIAHYQRDANAAFQRQDLDGAIRKWDQLLVLDPDNEPARLRKSQAVDLKRRLEKLGSK